MNPIEVVNKAVEAERAGVAIDWRTIALQLAGAISESQKAAQEEIAVEDEDEDEPFE